MEEKYGYFECIPENSYIIHGVMFYPFNSTVLFVPRPVCAQSHLCSDTNVPKYDCAHTIKFIHDCAKTCLCPDTFVPRHN